MPLQEGYSDQTAANALDQNTTINRLAGYGIISGGEAKAAGGLEVTTTQVEGYFAGETISASASDA